MFLVDLRSCDCVFNILPGFGTKTASVSFTNFSVYVLTLSVFLPRSSKCGSKSVLSAFPSFSSVNYFKSNKTFWIIGVYTNFRTHIFTNNTLDLKIFPAYIQTLFSIGKNFKCSLFSNSNCNKYLYGFWESSYGWPSMSTL